MATAQNTPTGIHVMKCKNCGASLKFAPGTNSLKCEFCNVVNEIPAAKEPAHVEEIDYEQFLNEHNVAADDKQTVVTVTCTACGATSTLQPNVTSDNCPFCDNALVLKDGSNSSIIKPKYLLPFSVDKKEAFEDFGKWIKGLWFAPNDLKNYANNVDKFNGMYIPYWTYTADTSSDYTGMRGDDYTEEESYDTTDSDGNTVTETRTVTHTNWFPVGGTVNQDFADLLVMASKSLPEDYASHLNPWDIKDLTAYDDGFLAGFRTEVYQVDVKSGFGEAKNYMAAAINQSVMRDIGGDHQRVSTINTTYNHITFKHILLPIWISAYRYNDKVYRILINGRTGAVKGERPYSWVKITLLVLAIAAAVAAVVVAVNK